MTASVISPRVAGRVPTVREEQFHVDDDIKHAFLDASTLCLEVTAEECWMAFMEEDNGTNQRGASKQKATERREEGRRGRSQNRWHDSQSVNDETTVASSLTLYSFDDIPDPKFSRNLLRSRTSNLLDLNESDTFDKSEDVMSTKSNGTKRVVQGILKNKNVDTRDETSAMAQSASDKSKIINSSSLSREISPGISRATSPLAKRAFRDEKSTKPYTSTRAKNTVHGQLAKDDRSTKSYLMSKKGVNRKEDVKVEYKILAKPKNSFAKGSKGVFLVV